MKTVERQQIELAVRTLARTWWRRTCSVSGTVLLCSASGCPREAMPCCLALPPTARQHRRRRRCTSSLAAPPTPCCGRRAPLALDIAASSSSSSSSIACCPKRPVASDSSHLPTRPARTRLLSSRRRERSTTAAGPQAVGRQRCCNLTATIAARLARRPSNRCAAVQSTCTLPARTPLDVHHHS